MQPIITNRPATDPATLLHAPKRATPVQCSTKPQQYPAKCNKCNIAANPLPVPLLPITGLKQFPDSVVI